ncbi:inner membrane symporter YihP, partial [Salmonella enterica subsp. enterica serovar Heidelberg str. 41584]
NFIGTPLEITGKTVVATLLFMLYGLCYEALMNCSYGRDGASYNQKSKMKRASLAA